MRKIVVVMSVLCVVGAGIGTYDSYTDIMENQGYMQTIEQDEHIGWKKNSDGSYTFYAKERAEGKTYAWQILDDSNKIVHKTKYSTSDELVYDLQDNRFLTVKLFVKENESDEPKVYKFNSLDIIGLKQYAIESVTLPQNGKKLLRDYIINADRAYIPVEEILNKNGSKAEFDLTADKLDWSCKNIKFRSNGFIVNGFLFLDDVYRKYCQSKDDVLAGLLVYYMIDWVQQNPTYDKNQKWIWHDDATAERVLRMSVWYDEFKNSMTLKDCADMEKSLAMQAKLLASNKFYTKLHNHGMHQDTALIAYALLHADNKVKKEYLQLAISRTGNYLDYAFTEDGIHKEHSPFYARDVLIDLAFFSSLLEEVSPVYVKHINQFKSVCLEYLKGITKPDGMWPSLGDSSPTSGTASIGKILLYENNEKVKEKLTEESMVYEKGGYAIFRNDVHNSLGKTWMLFNVATFSSVHKHGDDLEVLLYHNGDLFVEAGKRDYNYADKMTAWAYSGFAHNVLIVNDEAYPVKRGANGFQSIFPAALDTKITDYIIEENISTVTGIQHRFPGIEQRRTLSYDKSTGIVTIEDNIKGDKDYSGTLLWHVAEGVEVRQTGNGWEFYRAGNLVATMEIKADTEINIETVVGDEHYPYTAWIFDGKSTPIYGTLLKVNFACRNGDSNISAIVNLN